MSDALCSQSNRGVEKGHLGQSHKLAVVGSIPAPAINITPEQLEALGELSERASAYAAAATLPLPPQGHVASLRAGMEFISQKTRELYIEISGKDPWME